MQSTCPGSQVLLPRVWYDLQAYQALYVNQLKRACLRRRRTGNRAVRPATAADGSTPVIIPSITPGKLLSQPSHETVDARYLTWETSPTNATGIAQRTIIAVTLATTTKYRRVRSHHLMRRFHQMILCGATSISLGAN